MLKAAVLVPVLLALCAAPAAGAAVRPTQAAQLPTGTPIPERLQVDVDASIAVAAEHWGGPPPCGPVTTLWVPDLNAQGRAWRSCLIAVRDLHLGFVSTCRLITHEVGHLHGLGHGHPGDRLYDPALEGTVMDDRFTSEFASVPACVREEDRRYRIEERYYTLLDAAVDHRALCRRAAAYKRRMAAARRCSKARVARRRARLLKRQQINWPLVYDH